MRDLWRPPTAERAAQMIFDLGFLHGYIRMCEEF